ncbi:hypothetical protein [Streptomyces sp. NPDC052036]|uniref:hypothetical protein n=1 Tax=Streptomyces sp. NPDC052036 TaxID=3155171 RepID=UPI00343088B5
MSQRITALEDLLLLRIGVLVRVEQEIGLELVQFGQLGLQPLEGGALVLHRVTGDVEEDTHAEPSLADLSANSFRQAGRSSRGWELQPAYCATLAAISSSAGSG